jgi:hypothetical protein
MYKYYVLESTYTSTILQNGTSTTNDRYLTTNYQQNQNYNNQPIQYEAAAKIHCKGQYKLIKIKPSTYILASKIASLMLTFDFTCSYGSETVGKDADNSTARSS